MTTTIRKALPSDAQTILEFITELAEYEGLKQEIANTIIGAFYSGDDLSLCG